jgi:hypothetical protein
VRPIFRRRSAPALAMFLAHCLLAAPSKAQVEPVRLVYRAYAGCPDEARFVAEVTAHIEHARLAIGDEPARTFLVAVRADGARTRGGLQITELDGAVSRREVDGETCEAVVSALAFTTALAIDPRAVASAGAGIEADAGLPAPSMSTDGGIGPPAAGPAPPDRPIDRAPPPPASHPAPGPGSTSRWRWGSGVDARLLAGFVPGWAPGGGVFVDLARVGSGPLLPSLRVSLAAATTQAYFVDGVGAALTWRIARAEVCPVRLDLASFAATTCLDLDAGSLLSQGTGLANTVGDSRPWLVPGAFGRLSWLSAGGPWIEGAAGLGWPVDRYTFTYQQAGGRGTVEVYRVPVAGAELGLGVGYRFP